YEQVTKSEGIYGEKPLRWTYETFLGRLALEGVIKRPWFSAAYGRWADCSCSRKEVEAFIERFEIDTDEFLHSVDSFANFNDFFSRELKDTARPLAEGENTVSFPADGRHLFVPNLSEAGSIYAKGQHFDLVSLLGDGVLANQFEGGSALVSRLCPTDYHRFHFPLAGTSSEPALINGPLYSVNPIALSRSLGFIWKNKRRVTVLDQSLVGRYLFLEIGATNVGSIVDTAPENLPVDRGDEKGYFRFGGSMVIVLFPESSFEPSPDLAEHSRQGVELYAKAKDKAGMVLTKK
ncbi:MAG: phosphatidylserine decarboxylase, partial [Verrucomicrobiota bacterium]